METILKNKISIGISACIYGCRVRYNQKGIDMVKYLGRNINNFSFMPVCPECMAGLGTPRNAIKIVKGSGEDVWSGAAKVISSKGEDLTERLKKGSSRSMDILEDAKMDAFIFMEGSPSCGIYRTTLKNKRLGTPPGVFGSLLLKEKIFLIPGLDLQSPIKAWDWLRRLYAFVWLKNLSIQNKKQVYGMWHTMKFLCQEIDEKNARQIGKELANFDEWNVEFIEKKREEILNILRKPSTVAKIKQMLWKNYIHYKRKLGKELEFIKEPTTLRGMTQIAKELMLMEKESFQNNYVFGSSPILHRRL
ncbi:DUF523 domain-containing protein [Inediibacterium massiliense]|uniref:DUF523 domain-containing protein n=1 Tax=Inediibacterium massiliense TaxID=1658111 RepID=UPI0006B5F7CF|nr:DUF523 domain-containing protein [Inediibacterium massiliense]